MTNTSFVSTLAFRPVDLNAHLDVCIRFGIDAIVCAFGSADRFHEHDGKGAERYVERLRQRAEDLPGSLAHVWQGEEIIGLIVMGRLASDPLIGYVSLLYLVPHQRGQGLGTLLEAYAWTFLSGLGCQSLRLSASPTNTPAWKFYQYGGWRDEGARADAADVHLLHKEASDDSQGSPLVINPDDYLETEFGREFTPERNRQAWELAYARLDTELSRAGRGVHVYVVMGVQGAGKSRWVSKNLGRLGRRAIVFDAALPARRHREKLLAIIRDFGVPVIAVFVSASLDLALSRNASRSADKKVPEEALRRVFSLLELPTRDEGFVWSQTVESASGDQDIVCKTVMADTDVDGLNATV
ncbi:GNAT family N-acetyltransferase [Pseudomonas syringae group sp. J309-1]|uniref:GNAT family N-acetyltransferase n=1 Tax=Pseudomonas syringae group sp. J309-1 TaxID=3079588 RepID=UPI0029135098|nr:GNAT family N-acetyltransferase [Pseudomonas syringae group sp. J309-1]MDU8357477.1 GNAT family N-acetyltransferase [Pseudomonas syringae group sp. J309-1]